MSRSGSVGAGRSWFEAPLKGSAVPALALLAYSHDGIFSRLADADPLVVAAGRFFFAACALLPFVLARQTAPLRHLPRGTMLLTALAGLLLALDFTSWIAATQLTSIANSLLLTHVAPVWAVLLTYLMFRKGPSQSEIVAIGLSVLGASIITQGSRVGESAAAMTGDILAMASSLPSAAFLVLSATMLSRLPMLLYGMLSMGWAALFCFAGALLAGNEFPTDGTFVVVILGMGLVAQLLGHGGLTWSLHWHTPCFIAVVCLAEPVLGTLWAWLYFGEPVSSWTAAGGAIVLAAIAVGCRSSETAPSTEAPVALTVTPAGH